MEEWRPVPGWEELYEVSDQGRVRSLPHLVRRRHGTRLTKACIMTPHLTWNGYLRVILSDRPKRVKNIKIHRIVFAAFNGWMPIEINHLDLDKTNNWKNNLEPSNRKHNQAHAVKNGAYRRNT